MKAIAFAEHGNVFNWVSKKQECDKNNIKYIHAQEFYITNSLEEKVRDNYHVVLLARNWQAVKELNKLSSLAYTREDKHYYYDPRITIDELLNTSDNILVCTACIASPLFKGKDKPIYDKYLNFLIENKHRVFLEIQYHDFDQQKIHNLNLLELSQKHSLSLIAGTDTHSLNNDLAEVRKILLLSKNITYVDEQDFDLNFKSYNELVYQFEKQNVLPKKIYLQAIENTNLLFDLVEDFELDTTNKYPRLYNNAEEIFKKKINEGIIKRGIDKLNKQDRDIYYKTIKEELEVYKKCDAIDYMLLQNDIVSYAEKNDIGIGYGRGSVTGSINAYLLGLTEVDSIKFGMNFSRFINPDRISLADIDTDYPPSRRNEIISYVANKPEFYFSEIVTMNTVADKGSIREVGRALKMPLEEVDEIAKNYENNEEEYKKNYPKLFEYVDLLKGVNISVGSHPSGFVVSPIPIDENIGYFTTTTCRYPISQINMKELDSINYVKLDMLGLDNIEIINETCKLANIKRLTPDNIDFEDDNVWNEIKKSSLGIFQFESKFSHDLLIKVLNAVDKIKEIQPNIKRIDLMSMTNGAIRPSGESYRNDLCNGIFKDNGHPALNEFLADTAGYLIYQEQIIMFLVKFCGFSNSEADNVRRKIGKKLGTEDVLPEIKQRFIKTMHEVYSVSNERLEEIVEPFLKIIENASFYGFSLNHSFPYSGIGFACGNLRYYYPLEFITVMLNINNDNIEKTAEIIKYAHTRDIKIFPIKFRKSHAKYSFDKETNSIYKGISSIKFCNSQIAEELFHLKGNQYDSFVDLLVDIKNKTSCNTRHIEILIKLNFFSEFGNNQKLLKIYQQFLERYKPEVEEDEIQQLENQLLDENLIEKERKKIQRKINTKNKNNEHKKLVLEDLKEWEKWISNESLPIMEQILAECEFYGYAETKIPNLNYNLGYVISVDLKYTPKIKLYNIQNGTEKIFKVNKKYYNKVDKTLEVGCIIMVQETEWKNKYKYESGEYIKLEEKEEHIKAYYKPDLNKLNNYIKNLNL